MSETCPLCGTEVLSKGETWIIYGCLTEYRDGNLYSEGLACRFRQVPALRVRAARAEAVVAAAENWLMSRIAHAKGTTTQEQVDALEDNLLDAIEAAKETT